MKSVQEVLGLSAEYLRSRGDARARRHAEEILSHVLECKRLDVYLNFDRPLTPIELERSRELLRRKGTGEPFEYIVGEKEFYHARFEVTKEVLIPRQETEILLDKVVRSLGALVPGQVVWDLCTGSGCLGIALKKARSDLKVVLADSSPGALEVAYRNSVLNGVEVEIRCGDLLAPFQGEKADIVLCNPPYISASEYDSLDASVRFFEPKEALIGGAEGWEFYARLSEELPPFLKQGAKVFFEIGLTQGAKVLELFSAPYWKNLLIEKDWAGHDRFFSLEFE